MKKFYQKDRSAGRGRFDQRRDDRDRPQMYQATCVECGNECEVPFRPTSGRPVYCKSCFAKTEGYERGNTRDFGSRNVDRRMYQATCDQCGDRCEVPFRPSGDKPVYCNNCFGKNDQPSDRRGGGAKNTDQSKQDFAQLNAKLDEVIKLLGDIIKPKKIVKRVKADKEKVTTEE